MPLTRKQIRETVRANTGIGPSSVSDADLNSMINAAILEYQGECFAPAVDETLVQAADTYEYPLTGSTELDNLYGITDIWQEDPTTSGLYTYQVPLAYWRLRAGATPFVEFNRDLWVPDAGRKLRVEGQIKQPLLNLDSDQLTVMHASLVLMGAEKLLWNRVARSGGELGGTARNAAIQLEGDINEFRSRLPSAYRLSPRARRVPGRTN